MKINFIQVFWETSFRESGNQLNVCKPSVDTAKSCTVPLLIYIHPRIHL